MFAICLSHAVDNKGKIIDADVFVVVVGVVVASSRTGRPTSTRSTPASPSKGQKGTSQRSRSKSPFRSFRWKKSSKSQLPQTVASASDDEANYNEDEGCS